MTAVLKKKDASEPAKRGRPRSLHLDQVLDAALAVGLHRLTMGAVAQHLGVAKAVLYSYVRSREELTQLASAHAAQSQKFPEDRGQPWTLYVLEYSRALFAWLVIDGQMLQSFLGGGQGPMVEIDSAETWLEILIRDGFTGAEALELRRAITFLVVGAAANFKHSRAMEDAGAPRNTSARRAVLDRDPEQTVLLRQFVDVFARDVTTSNWEYALFLLLKGAVAAHNGVDMGLAPGSASGG